MIDEKKLLSYLPKNSYLYKSLSYVIKVGGKRFRPKLTYATASLFNSPKKNITTPAVAIEFIHLYSLIHDDLPAMDDDNIRHSNPSCHKKFDEATAILTGDVLQTIAFDIILKDVNLSDRQKVLMTQALSKFSIMMVDGQMLDLSNVNKKIDTQALKTMHRLKTGALLRCSIRLGALTNNNISDKDILLLDLIAKDIGLAYQIQDDVLETITSSEVLGKSNTSDIDNNKTTFIDVLGLENATNEFKKLYKNSLTQLEQLDNNKSELRDIINKMSQRDF
ncbi:Octaprenyl diphosphate synthase / Dimethylallyltransferase / (2E,6E)-farnesyl diphosphate synthase / Geranylgeranyl diphosphate synthase [hydrothermal vent metagenome]|uniref:Octaprenyl diphosphate synthase / Dimethylallyltransferase / (2E,6E)-farnesyl diphosphate synthase / Geranylgeranyl diphosphate synthase n=1 Tax=hydrothermal vent metagenome TaxID=652676 RepID=A0A1W1C5C1_9ZZZZ